MDKLRGTGRRLIAATSCISATHCGDIKYLADWSQVQISFAGKYYIGRRATRREEQGERDSICFEITITSNAQSLSHILITLITLMSSRHVYKVGEFSANSSANKLFGELRPHNPKPGGKFAFCCPHPSPPLY